MRMQSLFYTIQINGFKNLLRWDFHATVDWTQLCKFTSEFISRSRPRSYKKSGFKTCLVGGWTNPFEKYAQIGNLPQIGVTGATIQTLWDYNCTSFSCGFCYLQKTGSDFTKVLNRMGHVWSDSSVIDRHRCMWGVQKTKPAASNRTTSRWLGREWSRKCLTETTGRKKQGS